MSAVAATLPRRRCYTLAQAVGQLGFPSVNALRVFLCRRPGLVEPLYRQSNRGPMRLLTRADIDQIRALTTFRG